MARLPLRLPGHSRACQSALKAHFIRDDAFDGGDVWASFMSGNAMASDAVAVEIESHGDVVIVPTAPRQRGVEQQPDGGQDGQPLAGRDEVHLHTHGPQGVCQRCDTDEGTAAFTHVQRR